MREITLYVTSQCNRNCHECIMKYFMRANIEYQMSMDELANFLDISARSNYVFKFILSGGEPLLWKNLLEGVKLVKSSSVCVGIDMFSNAINIEPLTDEVMDFIGELRVSFYMDNQSNIVYLRNRYGDKVRVVDRTDFWVNPQSPVAETIPAKCLNFQQHLYMDHKIYACPHSGSIACKHNIEQDISTPLALRFLDKIDDIFLKQQSEICTLCISNQRVRDRSIKIPNRKDHKIL